jgi:hypothetical protein
MDRHQMRNAEFWTAVHAIVIFFIAFFAFIVGIGLGYRECEAKQQKNKDAIKLEQTKNE